MTDDMRTVHVTPAGLSLHGRHHRLLSGEVHYWRHDPSEWPAVLDAVHDLGFTTVSTYCSWARHERDDGSFVWDESFDVERFLGLVNERGMKAVVRVGPNSGAEQEDGGWPRRILDDDACMARRPGGAPYLLATATHHATMPSYASRKTLDAIAGWYDAVASRISPLQFPGGPVVAVQVDNEIGYHFQAHAYALDYHPDAIAQYREFLKGRYASIGALNAAYATTHTGWSDVDPPVDGVPDPTPWHTDWVRFKEHHLRATLATLAGMLRERGLDRVPFFHNDYPRTTTPQDLGALERSGAVDVAGADIYAGKEGGGAVRDLARHLAGSSTLPYMAELGTGWLTLPWLLPLATTPLDEEHAALRAFLHGVRAANVYQLVERDRWYGSPISAHGDKREPKASFYRRLHEMLDRLGWETLTRTAPVLLVENRDVARRVAARARHGDLVPCFSQLVPVDLRLLDVDDDEADAMRDWNVACTRACADAGVEADRASSDALPPPDRYAVVAVFRPDLLDPPIVHPGIVATPASLQAALEKIRPAFRTHARGVDLVHFTGDGREVVAAINGTPEEIDATISFDGTASFTGAWTPEEPSGAGSVPLRLAPWSAQVWMVRR